MAEFTMIQTHKMLLHVSGNSPFSSILNAAGVGGRRAYSILLGKVREECLLGQGRLLGGEYGNCSV